MKLANALAIGLAALLALSAPAFAEETEPTIDELLDATDDIQRGESSRAVIEMHVKTSRFERTMKMKALSKGTENSLITIVEPAKDAGTSTLKVGDNLWNYLPKVDRTMKIPAGMMGGSWMGSHFSNDDLVKQSRMSEDYTAVLTQKPDPAVPEQGWVIELTPKPDAPVVWGKVVVAIRPDRVPQKIEYYDEKGAVQRTMAFEDVREIDGRKVPMQMSLIPGDKPDEYTKITYDELEFDVDLPEKTFTLEALKR
ncbi:MAG: outer membrane lipoprotein-sorting protein [Alphaproteobacteria bacterium]|nr:outer membrane lipoprotein-sorting protein [Alphaproteobacteria bacterium]